MTSRSEQTQSSEIGSDWYARAMLQSRGHVRTVRRLSAGSLLVLVVVFVGCSMSSSPSSATARSACSTGPAYAADAGFPTEVDSTQYPQCVSRCGQVDKSGAAAPGFLPIEAVPSGTCEIEAERCSISVQYLCTSGTPGRVDNLRCACESGTWRCVYVAQGAGICPPASPPSDGGTD